MSAASSCVLDHCEPVTEWTTSAVVTIAVVVGVCVWLWVRRAR